MTGVHWGIRRYGNEKKLVLPFEDRVLSESNIEDLAVAQSLRFKAMIDEKPKGGVIPIWVVKFGCMVVADKFIF